MRTGAIACVDDRVLAFVGVGERGAKELSIPGEPRFVALEAIALGALPGLRPGERAMIVGAPLLAGAIGHALKRLFPRDRPSKTRFDPKGCESFPSTHVAHTTALLLAGAEVARRHGAGILPYAAAGAGALVIATARIRAAAHWPTDVLAGLVLGATAAAAAAIASR
jgi:membrane-associated phospholipid phosphatase